MTEVYNVTVNDSYTPSTTAPINDNWYWQYPYNDTTPTTNLYNWVTNYPTTVYMYQIQCPKPKCKKNNWLQLDIITPCTGCGAKLKAVSEQAEYEIAIS